MKGYSKPGLSFSELTSTERIGACGDTTVTDVYSLSGPFEPTGGIAPAGIIDCNYTWHQETSVIDLASA